MNTERGLFLTFEGGEGSGKSTQIAMLRSAFDSLALPYVCIREPGGTRVGEEIREILLDPSHGFMSFRAELLLYEAARAQLVAEVIAPALKVGKIVLCDRFYDSTAAYQGHARGLPIEQIDGLNLFAADSLVPDLTILLDVDPLVGIVRATGQGADRIEREGIEFHQRVRQGFLAIASSQPERFAVIDASLSPAEVHLAAISAVSRIIPTILSERG